MKDLDSLIKKHLPEVISFRHELHKIPELAGQEFLTSAYIRKNLIQFSDLEIKEPFIGTDVVALMGDQTLPNLTLRADIDALPIEEKNVLPYTSTRKGFMHACGHDGHAAMVYGAMLCLRELKEELNCSVRFLFQPGEEIQAMAKQVVEAGALENPKADFVAGLHNSPKKTLGAITTKKGAVMAAAGFFRITITGVGGHGSAPQSARNPLETASRIVLASKDIIPDGCVLTICAVNGGSNSNVIPEQAELQGTLRFLDPKAGEKMIADFEKLCKKICADDNVKCDYVLDLPYPVTMNGDSGYNMAKKCAEKYLGTENFQELPASSMGSEDFAYYLQKYNGFFAFLGTGADAENLHTEKFDFKDSVLEAGIKFFVGLALEFKGEKK